MMNVQPCYDTVTSITADASDVIECATEVGEILRIFAYCRRMPIKDTDILSKLDIDISCETCSSSHQEESGEQRKKSCSLQFIDSKQVMKPSPTNPIPCRVVPSLTIVGTEGKHSLVISISIEDGTDMNRISTTLNYELRPGPVAALKLAILPPNSIIEGDVYDEKLCKSGQGQGASEDEPSFLIRTREHAEFHIRSFDKGGNFTPREGAIKIEPDGFEMYELEMNQSKKRKRDAFYTRQGVLSKGECILKGAHIVGNEKENYIDFG
eukprot:TRINITY_DN887_c0_g1_i1.p2 TRINITY_DN887_c0_g1~~TRINITY_DN887_c0_g1_i1.p2  ORF type:complete len:267 (-),score=40.64 TRINITY_DN887_c0_g1_i1:964-1764(-)